MGLFHLLIYFLHHIHYYIYSIINFVSYYFIADENEKQYGKRRGTSAPGENVAVARGDELDRALPGVHLSKDHTVDSLPRIPLQHNNRIMA